MNKENKYAEEGEITAHMNKWRNDIKRENTNISMNMDGEKKEKEKKKQDKERDRERPREKEGVGRRKLNSYR